MKRCLSLINGPAPQNIALLFGAWDFDYTELDSCELSAYGSKCVGVTNGRCRAFTPLVVDASFNQINIPHSRDV